MTIEKVKYQEDYNDEYDSVCYGEGKIKKYWDPIRKKYKIFEKKDSTAIWSDMDYLDLMAGKWADMGRLLHLMQHCDSDNMLCMYDSHKRSYIPITTEAQFMQLLDLKKRSWHDFKIKLDQANVLKYITIEDGSGSKYMRYFINPLITMRTRAISPMCYKLFKEDLDAVLKPRAIRNLQRHSEEMLTVTDASDPIDEIAAITDKDKQAVFTDLILHNEQPQTYQLLDRADGGKKMVAHELTQNTDTYYLVNRQAVYKATKPADADIVGYRSWYIDIDAGRDQDGNYFSLDEIAERKQAMLQVIDKLPTPTAIVDTRNGYHIYFSIFGDVSDDDWQELQDRLIEIAGIADPAVRDKARVLRLPGSTWCKSHTGLDPYSVTILRANKQAYDVDSFAAQLNQCSEVVQAAAKSYIECYPMLKTKKSNTATAAERGEGSARINAIAALSTDTFVPAAPVMQQGNIIDYLHSIDLADFLQVSNPKSFKCMIHDDHSPSATIYANDIGGYRYFCGSTNCDGNNGGRGLDIIDVVRTLSGCSCRQAIAYLCKVYGIGQVAA